MPNLLCCPDYARLHVMGEVISRRVVASWSDTIITSVLAGWVLLLHLNAWGSSCPVLPSDTAIAVEYVKH